MIIDIVIIILLLMGALTGYKKGLIKILVSLLGIILAIVLASTFSIPVANAIKTTSFGNYINENVSKGINTALESKIKPKEEKESNFFDEIVENVVGEKQLIEASANTTLFILKGISFILIFLAVIIVCTIIRIALNLVFELPILNSINKIGGIAVGTFKSFIIIWILFAIISLMSPIPFMAEVINYIKSGTLASLLYTNNLFMSIISFGIKLI